MPLPVQVTLDALNLVGYEALVLHGSYARGDYTATSDVDIHAIYPATASGLAPFQVYPINGLTVEMHASYPAAILQKLECSPAWAHSWVRAEHLAGDEGVTRTLQQKAQAVLSSYAPGRSVINDTKHWLESASSKLAAALQASDYVHAGYLVNTNTWELLSSLWYVNTLPVPASTLMFKLTPQLEKLPEGFEEAFINLCSGNTLERAEAFHKISEWATTELNQLL